MEIPPSPRLFDNLQPVKLLVSILLDLNAFENYVYPTNYNIPIPIGGADVNSIYSPILAILVWALYGDSKLAIFAFSKQQCEFVLIPIATIAWVLQNFGISFLGINLSTTSAGNPEEAPAANASTPLGTGSDQVRDAVSKE